jgi:hypothetical protein
LDSRFWRQRTAAAIAKAEAILARRSCDRRRRAMSEYIVKIGFWLRGYDDFTVEANSNTDAI